MTIGEARELLQLSKETMTDETLQQYLTQFQFLIDEWFDQYERSIYDGRTLREITSGSV